MDGWIVVGLTGPNKNIQDSLFYTALRPFLFSLPYLFKAFTP